MAGPPLPVSDLSLTPTTLVAAVVAHATETGDLAPATLTEFADVSRMRRRRSVSAKAWRVSRWQSSKLPATIGDATS